MKLLPILKWLIFPAACLALMARPAAADTLTGIVVFSADLGGSRAGGQAWNTVGGDSWYNVYLATGTFPSSSPFVNTGDSLATTSISIPLSAGTYTYTLWGASNGNGGQPNFGINLFFNGSTLTPGISAYGPEAITASPASFSADAGTTLTMVDNFATTAPGSNTLTFGNVTLSGFTWYEPSVYNQNVVAPYNNTGGYSGGNFVGEFTLDVSSPSPVPEPGTLCLFGSGLAGLWLKRRSPFGRAV
jgi:hypothetical protein